MIALAIATLAAAEGITRWRGRGPWVSRDVPIRVEPGGSLYESDPHLGYRHRPGEFDITLVPTAYRFHVTHGADSLRATGPDFEVAGRPEIWIFGCSYTHGWSLDDEDTFPWRVQERFRDFRVVNFGVGGYGTLHSLIQFRDALETRPKPAVAVVVYASFHDERNTFARKRRKVAALYNRLGPQVQPFARLNDEGIEQSMAQVTYREFPFMRVSALAHLIENQYNALEDRWLQSRAVSKALLEAFRDTAREAGVAFVLAGITADEGAADVLGALAETGVATVDISVNGNRRHINYPHDPHPNALANRKYAERLGDALRVSLDAPR